MTIDDDELAALLRTAAITEDVPPPRFGHADVLAGSARIGRRRAVIVASTVAVVLLGGVGAVVVPQLRGSDAQTSAAAPAPEQATPSLAEPSQTPDSALASPAPDGSPQGGAAPDAAEQSRSDPMSVEAAPPPAPPGSAAQESPPVASGPPAADTSAPPVAAAPPPQSAPTKQAPGSAPDARSGPTIMTRSECGNSQDPELRRLLNAALPAVAGAPAAPSTQECLPAGQRAVSVQAKDGTRSGVLSVGHVPKGGGAPVFGRGATVAKAASPTGTVYVGSWASTGEDPFAGQLGIVASRIAGQL